MHQQLDFLRPARARRPRVAAYGGGRDSWGGLLLDLEHGEPPDQVVFCDVSDGTLERDGEDPGEWRETYRFLRQVVAPLCAREGIEFVWLDTERYPVREARSLFAWLWARQQIPVAGPDRICTWVAKTERFEAWLADTYPGEEVLVSVGFDAGERSRIEKDPNAGSSRCLRGGTRRINRFPLADAGLCRCMLPAYIRSRGFPVPPGSACMMCPYGKKDDWQRFAKEEPEQFAKVVELEARKGPTGRGGVKLSIMGYKTLERDSEGRIIRCRAPMLRTFIEGPYKPQRKLCTVCGEVRAAKDAGVAWGDEAA